MQIQAVNARALRKYGELVSAMDLVAEALESARRLIASMKGKPVASGSWTVPTRDELVAMHTRGVEQLDRLRTAAKKYEAELISREWRV